MKNFCKLAMILLLVIPLLSGCQAEKVSGCRVVTQVDISCQQKDVHIFRHYTDSQKMEYILLYLRLLDPMGPPETDPETVDANVYKITVALSDGKKKVYQQKDHRYLRIGNQPWQQIDPEQAAGLYRLLRTIPGDG